MKEKLREIIPSNADPGTSVIAYLEFKKLILELYSSNNG